MWASLRTRPDIQACTSILVLKRVWKYLRGTFWVRLRYTGGRSNTITTYSDASFAPQGSRSRTGITLFLGEDLISWRSVRQGLTAWSTMECETEAAAMGLQEAVKLQIMIEDLVGEKYNIRMLVDNLSCVTLLNKPTWNQLGWRTRDFAIRASWIRDQLRDENMDVQHFAGKDLVADALTKVLQLREMRQRTQLV